MLQPGVASDSTVSAVATSPASIAATEHSPSDGTCVCFITSKAKLKIPGGKILSRASVLKKVKERKRTTKGGMGTPPPHRDFKERGVMR